MRLCVIKVSGFSYMARFPSTCAALADALKRFPRATTVSVKAGAALPWPAAQMQQGPESQTWPA